MKKVFLLPLFFSFKFALLSQITFQQIHQSNVKTCDTIAFDLIAHNSYSTDSIVDSVILVIPDGIELVSGNTTQSLNQLNFNFGTISGNSSETISYDLYFSCETISPKFNASTQQWVTSQNTDTLIFNNDEFYFNYPVVYEWLTQGNPGNQQYQMGIHVGEVEAREHLIVNNGISSFNGGISFTSISDCPYVNTDSIEIIVDNNVIAFYLGNTFTHQFNNPINANQNFLIKEYISTDTCINECNGQQANFNINIQWGCDTNNLCKNISTITAVVERGPKRPLIADFRVEPDGDNPWYYGCFNLPENLMNIDSSQLKWQVHKIVNIGDANAYNINLRLLNQNNANGAQVNSSNYLVFENFFQSYYYNHETEEYENFPPSQTNLFEDYFDMNERPICIDNAITENLNPINNVRWTYPIMLPGDTLLVVYPYYFCCPNEDESDFAPYNDFAYFDNWRFQGGHGSQRPAIDECGEQSNAVQRNRESPDYGLFKSNQKGPNRLRLSQSMIQSVFNMLGPWDGGCSENGNLFTVQNTQFITPEQLFIDSFGNLNAQIKIKVTTDYGLTLSNTSNLVFANNLISLTIDTLSVTNTIPYGSCGGEWEIIYDFSSWGTLDSIVNFIAGSEFTFELAPCCPGKPTADFSLEWLINPNEINCDECWIPIGIQENSVQIQCPGCVTPGVIVNNVQLNRVNFDFLDSNNNGIADEPLTLYAANHQGYEVTSKRSIPGDTICAEIQGYGQDGDNSKGITYQTLLTNWANRNVFDTLKYLNIHIKNPCASFENFNWNVISDSIEIYSQITNSTATISLENFRQRNIDGDIYLYAIHGDSLRESGVFNNDFYFFPNDDYEVKVKYNVCGNPQDVNELACEFVTQMWWSSTIHSFNTPLQIPHVGDILNNAISDTIDLGFTSDTICGVFYDSIPFDSIFIDSTIFSVRDSFLTGDLMYICESNGALHYQYNIEETRNNVNFNNRANDSHSNQNSCKKSLSIARTLEIGGDARLNQFPFEFRIINPKELIIEADLPGNFLIEEIRVTSEAFVFDNGQVHNVIIRNNNLNINDLILNNQRLIWDLNNAEYQILSENEITPPQNSLTINKPNPYFGDGIYSLGARVVLSVDSLDWCETYAYEEQEAFTLYENNFLCELSFLDTIFNNYGINSSSILYPQAQLTHSVPTGSVQIYESEPCFELTLSNIVANNLAENIFFFFDTVLNSNIIINQVFNQNNSIISPDSLGLYQVNSIRGNNERNFTICLSLDSCLGDSTLLLPLRYGWQCNKVLQNLNETACFDTTVFIPLQLYPPTLISNPLKHPSSFALCDTVEVTAPTKAISPAQFQNLLYEIHLPEGAVLIENSVYVSIPDTNTTYLVSHDSIYNNTYYYSFDSNWILGVGNDSLVVDFNFWYVPTCDNQVLEMPWVVLFGQPYCGDGMSVLMEIDPSGIQITGDNCIPLVAGGNVQNTTCNQDTGSINLLVSGYEPISYLWNTGDTTQNLNNLPIGDYEVNITDGYLCDTTLYFSIINEDDFLWSHFQFLDDTICFGDTSYFEIGYFNTAHFGNLLENDFQEFSYGIFAFSPDASYDSITDIYTLPFYPQVQDASLDAFIIPHNGDSLHNATCIADTSWASIYVESCENCNFEPITSIIIDSCLGLLALLAPPPDSVLMYQGDTATYLWSTGDTTSYTFATSSGVYWVEMQQGDCIFIDSVNITQLHIPPTNPSAIQIGISPIDTIYLSSLINDNILPPNTAQGLVLEINGMLLIDLPEYTFEDCELYFNVASGIHLSPFHWPNYSPSSNTDLIISNSVLDALSNCEQMWRGITYGGNCGLSISNSKIINAVVGIEMLGEGASLNASFTEFNNNFMGIANFPINHNPDYVYFQSFISVDSCVFLTSNSGLLDPYLWNLDEHLMMNLLLHTSEFESTMLSPEQGKISYAGMYSVNNRILNELAHSNNLFQDLANGIILLNYRENPIHSFYWDVSHSKFENITTTSQSAWNGYNSNINNHAIFAWHKTASPLHSFEAGKNHINETDYGIITEGCFARITENTLENTGFGIIQQNSQNCLLQVANNSIESSLVGVYALNNAPHTLDVRENNINLPYLSGFFSGASRGIFVSETNTLPPNSAFINNNDITIEGGFAAIEINNASHHEIMDNNSNLVAVNNDCASGIVIDGGSDHIIAQNEIFLQSWTGLGNNNAPVGIDLLNSVNNIVECNTTEGTYTGIRLAGMSDGFTLRGHTFNNHFGGLRYTQSTVTNGTIWQEMHGNQWLGTYQPIDHNTPQGQHEQFRGGASIHVAFWDLWNSGQDSSAINMVLNHQFTIATNTPPFFPSATDIYPQGPLPIPNGQNLPEWFNIGQGTDFDCSQSIFMMLSDSSNIDLMAQTAEGTLPVAQHKESLIAQEQYLLYNQLKTDSTLLGLHTTVDSFYYAQASGGNYHQLYTAHQAEKEIVQKATQEKTIRNQYIEDSYQLIDSISYLDSMLLIMGDLPWRTTLFNEKEAMLTLLENVEQNFISIQNTIESEESAQRLYTREKYEEVNSPIIIDDNIRTLKTAWLSSYGQRVKPDSTEIEKIWLIAEQCPLSGGNAVFGARSFLRQYYKDSLLHWEDNTRCLEQGYSIKRLFANGDEEETFAFKNPDIEIFPNPTESKLHIQFKNADKVADKILLSNNLGQNFTLSTNNQSMEAIFDLKALVAGFYIIHLYQNGNKIHQQKIIKK